MKILSKSLLLFIISISSITVLAQEKKKEENKPIPEGEVSVTKQTARIDGKTINYTVTAGTILLRNGEDEGIALYGFTAYTKDGVTNPATRPVTFAYNGGPGSSSIWLHMGVLGPKRTKISDPNFTSPTQYDLVDNNSSIIDVTDLVMMDPVGTGLSHAVGKAENKDFWGVDQDIRSVGQFVHQYVTENDRWRSPKYLLGESYGTLRNAGVMNYLQESHNMVMNGVIMVSAVFDLRTLVYADGDDISYAMYLPTYAATAWYHDKVDNKPADVYAFIQESRDFAEGDYTTALMKGDKLTDAEREAILPKLQRFTGLSKEYLLRANLRVTEPEFAQELLRAEHKTVGRLDARFVGINQDLLSQGAAFDPQSSAISPAYKATFMDYYYNTLKVNKDLTYHVSAYARKGFNWDWKHQMNGGFFPSSVNTGVDMAQALSRNPYSKVLVINGIYDLATPFYGVEYSIDHLGLEPEIKKNIIMEYFEAGHMMYTHEPSLVKFKKVVADFINSTSK